MKPIRVAIVDPYTAGNLLAAELKALGHECIAVQSTREIPPLYRSSFHPEHFVKVIEPSDLQSENVSCVIAGCELGVQCADELSERLKLPTNGTKLSSARRNKKLMAEAVSKRGLRTPKQFASSSLDEIVTWTRAHQRWPVIIKPVAGCGSDGVHCCNDEAEVAQTFIQIIGRANMLGQINDAVLVQEFLAGPEYIIDTVSCAGRHRRAAFWKYNRPALSKNFVAYDSMQLMPYHGELQDKLFNFTCGVLDALEIRFGPAHCEVICVDGEPVLVEIGARMNGGNNSTLSRVCGGVCQLDLTIDAYLHPEKFLAGVDDPLDLSRGGANCFMMPHRAGILRTAPKLEKIESLRSFYRISFNAKPGERLKRVAGTVTLIHEDDSVIARDIEQLRQLQGNGFYDLEEGPRGE